MSEVVLVGLVLILHCVEVFKVGYRITIVRLVVKQNYWYKGELLICKPLSARKHVKLTQGGR